LHPQAAFSGSSDKASSRAIILGSGEDTMTQSRISVPDSVARKFQIARSNGRLIYAQAYLAEFIVVVSAPPNICLSLDEPV
jgi:hypothetical protein